MTWAERFREKWNVKSTGQFVMIMVVFALTGTTVLVLKRPVVAYFSPDGEQNLWFSIIYYILILPVYNIILLGYAFLLGQFTFFWNFEKKSFSRLWRRKKEVEGVSS